MALVRWEPVRELNSLQQEMNRLFASFFDTPSFHKGVLEVRIPKPEQRKPKKVAIQVGDAPKTIEAEGSDS